MRALPIVLFLVACGSAAKPKAPPPPTPDQDLAAAVDAFMVPYLAYRPTFGVDLGLHEYDGKVPDRSPAAIQAEITRLHEARKTFSRIDDTKLSKRARAERASVLTEIGKELFDLETRRRPYRDPFYYLFKFSLNAYIARDYAPAPERATAMLRACQAAPTYYQQAAANLENELPKAWLQAGVMISGGAIAFLTGDAKKAFADLPDKELVSKLGSCLDSLAAEVGTFKAALESRMATGTDDFRLGANNLVEMLRANEGLTVDIPTLQRLATADLERNRAAITAAAAAIDPERDVATVIAEVSSDKPAADQVIPEATAQLATLRQFLVDKQIVSLPRPDVVEPRESPTFMRGNFAAFSGRGPFEQKPLPSYYYIAPPDPAWPPEQQRAYIMSRPDLLFTSAHEVYPGHFIQGMHERASGSRVLQTFETYTASEGWAHYTEEMMWDAGLGNNDPKIHIGELKNALMRDVRFLVALGYHAGSMTVEEATKLFITQAFTDPKTAAQQAMRGTVDPMFLGYTLGKLAIMELRADWQKANPGKSLREFHDEFLSYGEAPLSTTRRLMLGDTASSPLAKPFSPGK
jgi:uncharacterized protein (DUF885 family)